MRVVTTCHQEGFDVYGKRVLDGWKHWPKDAELHWYTEGYRIPDTPGVVQTDNERIQGLQDLKRRYACYVPPSYLFDVCRFANKVYAAADALMDYKGIGVWMDADCVTFADIPAGYVENLLERGSYLGIFNRTGMYTETGFWVMDCSHEMHQEFINTWLLWYESRAFSQLTGFTDCHTLDATIRKLKVPVTSLSGEFAGDMHPMAKVDLAKYIDHCKGPRKVEGRSPENANR